MMGRGIARCSLGRRQAAQNKTRIFKSSVLAAAALSFSTTSSSSIEALLLLSPGGTGGSSGEKKAFLQTRSSKWSPSFITSYCTGPGSSQHQQRPFTSRGGVNPQATSFDTDDIERMSTDKEVNDDEWSDILPMEDGSHNSARIRIADLDEESSTYCATAGDEAFRKRLEATIMACRELGKSSLWIDVPLSRASLMEPMGDLGLRFHHAFDETAVLNIWLQEGQSKIPEFATHNVGVGAVVVNSRDEILCVRELRRNYRPWKTPTGLTELGEQIDEGAIREVLEETGIRTKFHSLLGFRQTHGLAHDRSDLFFVCRLDPIEDVDEEGNAIIPKPTPQECEIEKAEWVPLSEYRAMVNGDDKNPPHPMMQHVMKVLDEERHIEKRVIESIVPGRKPNAMFYPVDSKSNSST